MNFLESGYLQPCESIGCNIFCNNLTQLNELTQMNIEKSHISMQ